MVWDDHYGTQANPYSAEDFARILELLREAPDADTKAGQRLIGITEEALATENGGENYYSDVGEKEAFAPEVKWGIWCAMSGGMTGSAQAWMKEDGELWLGSEEEAGVKAREAMKNSDTHGGPARFTYTAMEFDVVL